MSYERANLRSKLSDSFEPTICQQEYFTPLWVLRRMDISYPVIQINIINMGLYILWQPVNLLK